MKNPSYYLKVILVSLLLGITNLVMAQPDLEVMYIERSSKGHSYHGKIAYENGRLQSDDFMPYRTNRPYGLNGQDETTERWPANGENITFTAHIRNSGSSAITNFDYDWKFDGTSVASGIKSVTLNPGEETTITWNWAWEFAEHKVTISVSSANDSYTSNNLVNYYTNALRFFDFIDEGYLNTWKSNTVNYPNATTSSLIEWCHRHVERFNEILIEAGCVTRVAWDRLEIVEDYPAALPSYDRTNYDGDFPTRFKVGDGDYRESGYYDASEDIDYGFLHELGHQLGIIDLYRLNLPAEKNEVNSTGYSTRDGLMTSSKHFISEHTKLALNSWHGKRRGYFGEYQYAVPTTNTLKFFDFEGQALSNATITVYQKILDENNVDRIPNTPKFTGTTNSNGEYVLPNVYLADKDQWWTATGDVLKDNPFGYINNVGHNGVFLIKIEKSGGTDFQWIDITDFNVAYWKGNTESYTYTFTTSLGRGMELAPLTDMAEDNSANWDSWAENASASVTDDSSIKTTGSSSIKMVTDGGFDTYIRYPQGITAHWDLRNATTLNISFRSENSSQHGFQGSSPWIRLISQGGSYVEYTPTSTILNETRDTWKSYQIPLSGNGTWTRSESGSPDISDITAIEIHADTWDNGFTLWTDAISFSPQPSIKDDDNDQLPDAWEVSFFGNLSQSASDDYDNDSYSNLEEYQANTSPSDPLDAPGTIRHTIIASVEEVSSGCSVADWDAGATYWGGDSASYNGNIWKAKWWTRGETPGSAQVWEDLGVCGGGSGGTNGTITPLGNVIVDDGANQTFTMTPDAGFTVGDVLVDNVSVGSPSSYTFSNVTTNHTISVRFDEGTTPVTYQIQSSAGANGTISPSGIAIVNEGENQSYTISASSGYEIDYVLIDGNNIGAASTYTFNAVSANHTIEAFFKSVSVPTYTITATANSNGTISPNGNIIVNEGNSASFTITANSGYEIDYVLVDGNNIGAVSSYNFNTVTANHSIEAFFKAIIVPTYTITVTSGANGSISPSSNVVVNEGDNASFTITANSGYEIDDVLVDGSSVGAVSTYNFNNVTANHSISATFKTASTGGICDGIAEWNANQSWTEYSVGDQRTNNGQLWECINVAYSIYEPSGPWGHYGWTLVGNCN